MLPRKHIILYCCDEWTESRIRLVLESQLLVKTHRHDDLPMHDEMVAAVVWQNPGGRELTKLLRGLGLSVVEVAWVMPLPGQFLGKDMAGVIGALKTAMKCKRGPKRVERLLREIEMESAA